MKMICYIVYVGGRTEQIENVSKIENDRMTFVIHYNADDSKRIPKNNVITVGLYFEGE